MAKFVVLGSVVNYKRADCRPANNLESLTNGGGEIVSDTCFVDDGSGVVLRLGCSDSSKWHGNLFSGNGYDFPYSASVSELYFK